MQDYVVRDEDLSRKYKAHEQLDALQVGQSFTFPAERLQYFRHRASKQGKMTGRVFSVNKSNLSVTRKK